MSLSRRPTRQPQLEELRGFCAAVDLGSISRAAEKLHLTQPAMSRRLHALEKALGGELLERSTAGVRMKLVANLLLGVNMEAIAEAVSLGEHLQLNRDILLDVLPRTAVIAPALLGKILKIKTADYSPQFPLHLMSKDMNLVGDAADNVDLQLELARKSNQRNHDLRPDFDSFALHFGSRFKHGARLHFREQLIVDPLGGSP